MKAVDLMALVVETSKRKAGVYAGGGSFPPPAAKGYKLIRFTTF